MPDGQEAGRPRRLRPSRRAGKAQSDARRVTGKYTLHLGVETWKRLGVHATLSGRDKSRLADEILTSHLARYGQGRELFGGPLEAGEESPPAQERSAS
jgi:hypothetical protein